MTLPAETSLNRKYSLRCQIMQDGGNLASNSDAITIVPTDGTGDSVKPNQLSPWEANQKGKYVAHPVRNVILNIIRILLLPAASTSTSINHLFLFPLLHSRKSSYSDQS